MALTSENRSIGQPVATGAGSIPARLMAESWVRLWAGMTTDPKFLALMEARLHIGGCSH